MAQYRRSIFLINRPFQLRFAFYVCSWIFALSIVYPLIIFNLFDFFTRYLSRDPNGPTLVAIHGVRQEIVLLLVFFQVVFMLITFMISIFMAHRIAGPLYKLKNFFRQNAGGKLSPDLHFRKNDHFIDVADEYNSMMSRLRADLSRARERIESAANELDGMLATGQPSPAQLKKLVATLHEASEKVPH